MGDRAVVVDVNILQWIGQVDEGYSDLLEFILNAYGAFRGIGEHEQIRKNRLCGQKALLLLDDHGVSDFHQARGCPPCDPESRCECHKAVPCASPTSAI